MTKGYSTVNGLSMYYEIHGDAYPLVLIHGGGSTIDTSFGVLIPILSQTHQIIAVELQAHGRSSDRDAALSFEQDADDVAQLLSNLNIRHADILGFSNGATTALQIAIRHPQLVRGLILASALAKRHGVPEWFWGMMAQSSLDQMPQQLKTAYLQVAHDPNGLQNMHDKDATRMLHFKDIEDAKIQTVTARTLIIIGDQDIIKPEHALELQNKIHHAILKIIPGGHGEYMGEITTLKEDVGFIPPIVDILEDFLER